MSRIDWIIVRRLAARIGITVLVFYGLFALIEMLDAGRFQMLTEDWGVLTAIKAVAVGAARTIMGFLPVLVLLGTILGVLDLQSRRELTIIKSSGMSIWRILRGPMVIAFAAGAFFAFVVDALVIETLRSLPARGTGSEVWLEQQGSDGNYLLHAERVHSYGTALEEVTVFFTDQTQRDRVEAVTGQLVEGAWELAGVKIHRIGASPEIRDSLRLATVTTAPDMRVRVTSPRELTFAELVNIVSQNVADPELRASATTALFGLCALPALFVGSVLIGFAFTSAYQRTNKYGGAVLYGVVIGFVVYVVTELAYRSGYAGVLDPAFAAGGSAFVAIVIGLTVLLFREDGRA